MPFLKSSLMACFILFGTQAVFANKPAEQTLRVQLQWSHQTQFAGFYLAQDLKYFKSHDLNVLLYPGGPGINPIVELQEGRADIAISWLANAWNLNSIEKPVVNIAQLFSGESLLLICRNSLGVYRPSDIQGKRIGIWKLGDEIIVNEILRSLSIPLNSVELFEQRAAGKDLIEGGAPCVTAMVYNEYWQILEAGVPASDLVIVRPDSFHIPHVEDGVYVLAEKLESPEFRNQLARFIIALRQGWVDARISPTLAVEATIKLSPYLNKDHQRHMLDSVLAILPTTKAFGFLDPDRFQLAANSLNTEEVKRDANIFWTHKIFNEVQQIEGHEATFYPETISQVRNFLASAPFQIVLLLGTCFYGLYGALAAFRQGYLLWGQLLIAFVCALGGGMLRDVMIAGDRMPFGFIHDPTAPIGISLTVLSTAFLLYLFPRLHEKKLFHGTQTLAEAFGFGVLTVYGAMVALNAGLAWYWLPACSAITCAGGGIVMNMMMGRESRSFRGALYEEVALLGGLLLVAVLAILNQFEHVPNMISIAIIFVGILTGITRYWIDTRKIGYPAWLRSPVQFRDE